MKEMKKELKMWQYMFYISVIIILLCGITFLLYACTKEINNHKEKPSGSGKMVEVKFALNSAAKGDPETVTRNYSDMQPETVEVYMGDNMYMYATIMVDREVNLRATELLRSGTQVRIVAYRNGSNNPNDGYADFTINASGDLSGGSLMVEDGQSYSFAAYSYNTNTLLPAHHETLSNVSPDDDLLWGSASVNGLNVSTLVPITLYHQFAQVSVHATTADNLTPPIITNFDDVSVSPGYSVNLNVKEGTCTQASPENSEFDAQGWSYSMNGTTYQTSQTKIPSTYIKSSPRCVFTDGAVKTFITFDNLYLNGYTNPFPQLVAEFNKILKPGVSYILKVNFKKGSIWAGSNIYWDGNQLTFEPAENRSLEHYQGVFFKWGSLVGISPSRSGGKLDIGGGVYVYSPVYNTSNPALSGWDHPAPISNWATILPVSDISHNLNRNDKYLTNMGNTAYYSKKGDICQFLGDIGAAPQGYRMPTSNEMGTSWGDWINSPGPVAGGWMRVGANGVNNNDFVNLSNATIAFPENGNTQSGKWINSYVNPNGGISPSGATYQGAFFPTSGWRSTIGDLDHVGVFGYYWSGTIGDDTAPGNLYRAFNLEISATALKPAEFLGGVRHSTVLSCAMPIRCVKKNPDEN